MYRTTNDSLTSYLLNIVKYERDISKHTLTPTNFHATRDETFCTKNKEKRNNLPNNEFT